MVRVYEIAIYMYIYIYNNTNIKHTDTHTILEHGCITIFTTEVIYIIVFPCLGPLQHAWHSTIAPGTSKSAHQIHFRGAGVLAFSGKLKSRNGQGKMGVMFFLGHLKQIQVNQVNE